MGEIKSSFSSEDIKTLLEAMSDWESMGNQEFHLLGMVKGAPMPPEDHEAYEYMQNIKDHFRNREKDIMASREMKQEKAVFLKAKLMLVRKDMAIDKLFDMAANTELDISDAPIERVPPQPVSTDNGEEVEEVKVPVTTPEGDLAKKLELAEFFIKDLGVWAHYEKFLAEKSGS